MKHPTYPMGSVSTGTMRTYDLIPAFLAELRYQMRSRRIKGHAALARDIERDMRADDYYESEGADWDLEALFDALNEYAGPYFYFGAPPEDGADYGYWVCENLDADFDGLRVQDLADVPKDYRGEVLHVNDHGNMALYVKSARTLREVWSIV